MPIRLAASDTRSRVPQAPSAGPHFVSLPSLPRPAVFLADPDGGVALPRQLSVLQRRAREALGSTWLRGSTTHRLQAIAQDVLSLIKQIHAELPQDNHDIGGDPRRVKECLVSCHARLDLLTVQFQLLDLLRDYVGALRDVTTEISGESQPDGQRLSSLASIVIKQTSDASAWSLFLPIPGVDAGELIEIATGTPGAEILTQSVLSALLSSWLLHRQRAPQRELQSTVEAALMQDVGLLILLPHRSRGHHDSDHSRRMLARHPLLGAAIASGILNSGHMLSASIAQHHERPDGSGSPRGLKSTALLNSTLVIGAANRFLELSPQSLWGASDLEASQALATGLRELQTEAEAGLWSRHLVQILTSDTYSITGETPIEFAPDPMERRAV